MSSALWCVERRSSLLPLWHCNAIRDLRHLTSDPPGARVILRSATTTERIHRDLCVRTAQLWAAAGHFQLFGRRSRQCDVQMIAQWMNYHSTEHKSCTESVGEHDCGCIAWSSPELFMAHSTVPTEAHVWVRRVAGKSARRTVNVVL